MGKLVTSETRWEGQQGVVGMEREGVDERGRREGKRSGEIWIGEVTTAEATVKHSA